MIKGKTKITTVGGSKFILIPETIFNDSVFPLKEGKELDIEIKNKEVVIR